jgi:pSer/pThr/pTyr-binding forkhead associated (FHA) protein
MSPLRVLRGLVFGGAGGIIGWILIEAIFQPTRFERPGGPQQVTTATDSGLMGALLGLAIGLCLGISEGIGEGTNARFKRAVAWFTGLGAVGGFLGMYFGQSLFAGLGGKIDPAQIGGAEFVPQVVIRASAWMLIGLFLGCVFGVPSTSPRRMWNGAIGGAMGGFLGGFVFQTLALTRLFEGMQLRFLGFGIVGASVGFFISLFVEALKRTWVKVLIGRNEGRDHTLDTPIAYVGRDELAEVPVFLDPLVPRRVASFRLTGGRYALFPETNAMPIMLNGQALVPGHVLRDGDAIQFGKITLAYNEKATATGARRPVDSVPLSAVGSDAPLTGTQAVPTAAGVCQFCGQRFDPTGACACSVPADMGALPGMDPGMAALSAPGYATQAYGTVSPWGAPPTGAHAPHDPAYAATVMDPSGMGYPGGAAPAGPRLVVTGGPYVGQAFPVLWQEAGIGRDPSQEIPLPADNTASRRHARLVAGPMGLTLRDEGSSNGTWVNGVRIQEQPLQPGDTIRIGGTYLTFEA